MKKILLSAAGVLLCAIRLFSQTGSVDLTFNAGDLGYYSGEGPDYNVLGLGLQADGSIVIGGQFYKYNYLNRSFLARVFPNGQPDPQFPAGDGPDGIVRSVVIQPDGKILIAGDFSSVGGFSRSRVARLNVDGSVDTTFDPGSGLDGDVYAMTLRPNGKIILGGYFFSYDGNTVSNLVQVNSDGSFDSSFNPGSGPDSQVIALHLHSDGSLFVGGYFYYFNGVLSPYLAKIDQNGVFDLAFTDNEDINWVVTAIGTQPDGRILIGGAFSYIGSTYTPGLARLMPDGSLDTSFNTGSGLYQFPFAFHVYPDGKILVAGDCDYYDGQSMNNIMLLHSDGTLDTSFNAFVDAPLAYCMAIQPDGNILLGGQYDDYLEIPRALMRLFPDGQMDTGFNPMSGASGAVSQIAELPNGKVMILGGFNYVNNEPRHMIARLLEDGTVDPAFPAYLAYNIERMIIQPDGKVLLWGYDNGYFIKRLSEDGSLDPTFANANIYDGQIYRAALLPDGKILVTGYFYSIDGTPSPGIARLNADGTIDPTFIVTSGLSGTVEEMIAQPDGKVIMVGYFYLYNDTGVEPKGFRLNADGTIDNTFSIDALPYESSNEIKQDSQGRILYATLEYDGICCYTGKLLRLMPDGSIDPSFTIVSAPSVIGNIAIQNDGKILITENEDEGQGDPALAIRRLLPDGNPDPTFNIGSGPSSEIYCMTLDVSGRILVGGNFYHINNVGRNRFARLLGETNICAQVDFLCLVDGQPIGNMKVELFKVTGTNIELQGAQSFTDAAGHTAYVDIPEGQYICRASPNPGISGQENLLSTFTNETYTWQQADILEVSCGMALLDTIDIIMLPAPGTFPGNASGTVRYMTDPPGLPVIDDWLAARSFVTGDPIPGVPCVIERDTTSAAEPSGNYFPFQLSVTNVGGEYGFVNLPTGHYKIHVDMPGLPLAETHLFQVTVPEPTFSELNFYVDPNDAIYIHDVIGVEEVISHTGWVAYPNPFRNALTLVADGPINGVSYELLSFEGKTVMTGRLNGSIGQLETSDLSRGIYFLRLNSNGEVALFKVIKE